MMKLEIVGALFLVGAATCAATVWQPEVGATWQWQIQFPVNTSFNVDMYDIDLFGESRTENTHRPFTHALDTTTQNTSRSRIGSILLVGKKKHDDQNAPFGRPAQLDETELSMACSLCWSFCCSCT